MSSAAATPAPSEAGAPKKSKKKMLILLAIPLVLIAVLAGLWFGGILPPLLGMGGEKAATLQARACEHPPQRPIPAAISTAIPII